MSDKPFDSTKPFQLRSGTKARLLGRINNPTYPLVVAFTSKYENPGVEITRYYSEAGKVQGTMGTDYEDLVNIPQRIQRTVFLNVYSDGTSVDDTRSQANALAGPERIACLELHIDFVEGEGL